MFKFTQEELRNILSYDPETGEFVWKLTLSNRAPAGSKAGTWHSSGYRYITILGHRALAHRLAWYYMTGEQPPEMVDHFDTDSRNNKWGNLRASDAKGNAENKRRPLPSNVCGLLGVSPKRGRFKAQIQANKKNRSLGTYDTPEEAHTAYVEAKRVLHAACTL